ncbi:MAG: thioredoxin family protein [Dehalococcoidia bacterium]
MVERLLLAAALVAGLVALVALGRWWYARRNARIEVRLRSDAPTTDGGPRIVYFTTATCIICKAQQEPAIAALQERLPDVRIERHDAVEERALADRYGVLSVPTTAVYDRGGRLVTVNRGFTPAAVLLAQAGGQEPAFEGGASMPSEPLA